MIWKHLFNLIRKFKDVLAYHLFKVKLIITICSTVLVLFFIDLKNISMLFDSSVSYVIIVIATVWILNQILLSYRYKLAASLFEESVSISKIKNCIFAGYFANFFVPGEWGIQAFLLRLNRELNINVKRSATIIFFDSLSAGVGAALGIVVCVFTVVMFDYPSLSKFFYQSKFPLLFIMAAIFLFTCMSAALVFLFRTNFVKNFSNQFAITTNPKWFISLFIVGVLSKCSPAIMLFLIGTAVKSDITIIEAFLVSNLALLVASIPISIQGLGTRDAAMTFLLVLLGVKASLAAFMALVFTVSLLLFSVCCAPFYFYEINRR